MYDASLCSPQARKNHMSTRTLTLDDRLYDYLVGHSLRDTPEQQGLRELTHKHPQGVMQISPEQGQLMSLLVKLIGAKRIIEIGTFTGYSALCMAQALPSDGELICCDVSSEWTDLGRPFWQAAGIEQRIDLRIAPALQTLDSLLRSGQAEDFDLAFIDADKSNYLHYYERCLELVKPGGLIMFDNTLWSGAVADPKINDEDTRALRALNSELHQDTRIDISILPIGDGLTLARKRAH
jgi:predicted O-methyltransferase YrrM